MAASAGGRCPGYTPNKAACCFHVCPAAHSGSSSTPKGRFSPTQASQESVSQPANTWARAGCRKASQTPPAETSSPKSNSTEKGEVTKGSLETLRTLAVEKEQPCSTSSGCQWDRTGQCFPRGSWCCTWQAGKALWTLSLGWRSRSKGTLCRWSQETHPSMWSYAAGGFNSAHPITLHSISMFLLPSCALYYPGFYIFGLLQPSDFIF